MKKFTVMFALIFSLILSFGLVFLPSEVSYATENYANAYIKAPVSNIKINSVAGVSNIPVRDLTSGKIVFYMPESYYAKVVGLNEDFGFFTVEFSAVTSDSNTPLQYLIYKADLGETTCADVVFESGVSPSPNLRLQLKEGAKANFNGSEVSATDGFTFKYIGGAEGDKVFVTAQKGEQKLLGAVDKTSFETFSVPYHPVTEAERQQLLKPADKPATDAFKTPAKSSTLRIILIIGIVVPAVLIVLLLFKPSKGSAKHTDKRAMKKSRKKGEYDYDRSRSYGAPTDSRYASESSVSRDRSLPRDDDYSAHARDNYDRRDSHDYRDNNDRRDERYDDKKNRYDDKQYDNHSRDYDDRQYDNRPRDYDGNDNRNFDDRPRR